MLEKAVEESKASELNTTISSSSDLRKEMVKLLQRQGLRAAERVRLFEERDPVFIGKLERIDSEIELRIKLNREADGKRDQTDIH